MSDPMIRDPQVTALLQRIAAAPATPSADLWPRIGQAHALRVQRRRRQRAIGAVVVVVACLGAIAGGGRWFTAGVGQGHLDAHVDWQARAQALEWQLHSLDAQSSRAADAAAVVWRGGPAEAELADIDHRLQSVYEHGARDDELLPLWKRRSELLDTLIQARKEGLTLTSI